MPLPYPPEFRARAVALVRAGKQAKQTAVELGIHPVTLSNWIRQDDIDHGCRPGVRHQNRRSCEQQGAAFESSRLSC